MRRKSERTNTNKKAQKVSPEKKVEKVKKTRGRRRKQSTSSENESAEEIKITPTKTAVTIETAKGQTPSPVNEASNPEGPDQVWQVKTSEGSGDTGEIQKLKICLTRPPSTPERVDRSPRSKRKHSRATSSSDTASVEIVEEKKKGKHRSKRLTRESKDELEHNYDSQGDEIEPESEVKTQNIVQSDSTITQSSDSQLQPDSNEIPMSTTNEEEKIEIVIEVLENQVSPSEIVAPEMDTQNKPSDADTTVVSPKPGTLEEEEVSVKENVVENKIPSEEKSEALEIHAEDDKPSLEVEVAEPQQDIQEEEPKREIQEKEEATSGNEVSKMEDKTETAISEPTVAEDPGVTKGDVENNVVVNSGNDTSSSRKMSTDEKVESSKENNKEVLERSVSTQSTKEENTQINQSATLTINRKRRWGSRPSKIMSQTSITISTDVLKDIISDVKPVEFDEVIDEKKQHKRIEVTEKSDRPVLPKIVIDNTENVEQNKKEYEESKERDNVKSKESHLGVNRKISIVKDNESITARPPSPPRHKQSCILYITNLVRPFTLSQLKNLLQRTGRIVEDGFWIDKIKSKCYVKYETEDQAFETRHALHGVTWPVSNPKSLQVDFSSQDAFDKAKANEDTDNAQATTIPGTVEDWLREQDMKRERGEVEKPWERKAAVREWDVGKDGKEKDNKDKIRRDERMMDKRRHKTPERSPEPAKKFKKEEEAPAKLLDNLFRKTKTTPCIYWLPLSAETIAIKEEQRRQHMAEHERRMQELRRTHRPRH